ncbi:hypothetical protein RRG08_000819 [Elysia crispata]|uniref:Uncharacterized protein n=1 Tax=Elysia crispata TaxID=231223 RepID=A0AAE1E7Y3_9GAST|nr:hypothetical protein RRG08_000819 [Elysia crispata]
MEASNLSPTINRRNALIKPDVLVTSTVKATPKPTLAFPHSLESVGLYCCSRILQEVSGYPRQASLTGDSLIVPREDVRFVRRSSSESLTLTQGTESETYL